MLGTILATVEAPTESGSLFAIVFWIVMSMVGINKCVTIARRETTSSICVHSLTLTIAGYLIMLLLQLSKKFLQEGLLKTVLSISFAVLICLIAVVGVTLAIVGLSIYRRSFNDDGTRRGYKQGRKQAGWAIGLNCIFLTLFMIGLIGGMMGRTHLSAAQKLAAEIRDIEYERQQSEVFGYTIDLRGSDWKAWQDIHASDFLADAGGLHPDGTRFTVVPMALPLKGTPIEMVHKAYLELYGFLEPIKEDQLESVTIQEMPAYLYSYANSENECVEQIVLSTNLAYLVAVWRPVGQTEGLDKAARAVFDSVSFNPPAFDFQSLKNLPVDRRAAQGKMINRIGLGYYNAGRYPEAVDWFSAGFGCDKTNAVYFSNILSSHHQLGQQEEALALLEQVPQEIRNAETIQSWEAALLYGTGRVVDADAAYSTLFATDYRSDADFMEWTRLRADNGLWEGLGEVFADYMAPNPGVDLQLHQLDLYYSKGDYEHVADLARSFLKRQGFSADIANWLIDACQELGLYNEALKVSEQLIEKGYVTVNTYQEKAYCEYKLKWYRQSKITFERALKLNPRNETTKEWLGIISAELGEGDNSLLKDSIDPVELPKELLAKVRGKPVPDFGKEFGAYYAQYLTLWKYEKGKELKRTNRYEIKVLDDAGISAFSSLEYSFDPTSEEIFVNELEVLDTNDTVVARGAIKDYYVLDDDSDGLVSEDKKLMIPVPNLQSGYTIKATVTRRYSSAADEFYFKRHFMAAGYPVLHAGVYLGGDVADVTVRTFNGIQETRVENGVLWTGPGAYAYKREPLQIPVERFVPGVALGGEEDSWQACGLAYLEEITDQLEIGAAPRKKAEALVADCKTAEEKYAAIMGWIRASFTYKPLEFGRDAYIPDTAADTLSYRYGDCKDFAVLLKVMLEAVGVKCDLVLASTDDDVYEEIFTTDQFNHMIAYLPEIRAGLFVDPTDQDSNAFIPVPQGLSKQQVLVLDSEDPRLLPVPDYLSNSSSCSVKRVVSVKPGAPVSITEHVVLHGYYASWMRSAFKDRQKVKWAEWFQQNVAYLIRGVEVQSVTARHVTDPSRDLELNIIYTQGNSIPTNLTEKVELDIQPLWAHHYLGARSVQHRKNPFRLKYPLKMKITSKVVLAAGMQLELQHLPAGSGNDSFLEWSVSEMGIAEYTLKPGNFTAQEYGAYVDSMNRGIKAAHLRTQIMKGGNKKELAKK